MNQYDKSGPAPETHPINQTQVDAMMQTLRDILSKQQKQIQDLEKEIRRIKEKIDRHADYLNGSQRG